MTTIDYLLISERYTLFPFGEVPVTWGMDQLASLEIWPRLRKLHVFSSYADSLRNWIWPILSLCSGLQEFVLHPVMCASPAGLLLLPRTIRYIEILLPFFWTVEDFPIIKQWLATLYEMLDPSRRPNLAFLVVNLQEVVEKELICVAAFAQLDDRAWERSIRQYNNDIHAVIDDIRLRCDKIGAHFKLCNSEFDLSSELT